MSKHPARKAPPKSGEARLGFRLPLQKKELIERAAEIQGRKVTDFCVAALERAAEEAVAKHDALAFSERDRIALFDALANPPRLAADMRNAIRDAGRMKRG